MHEHEMKAKNDLIDHFLVVQGLELQAKFERDALVERMNNMPSWTHDVETGDTWMHYLLGDTPWQIVEYLVREIKSCGFNIAHITTGRDDARYIRINFPR